MKRIGFFFTKFHGNKAGVDVYMNNLLRELLKQSDSFHFTVFAHSKDKKHFKNFAGKNLNFYWVSNFWLHPITSILWHHFACNFFQKIDLYFIPHPGRAPFFSRKPRIVVMYDMAIAKSENNHGVLRYFYNRHLLGRAFSGAKKIICISNFTRKDFLEFYPKMNKESVKRIYLGFKKPAIENNDSSKNIEKYNPYILYCARIEHPKKNHINLCKAFSLLKERKLFSGNLILAGGMSYGHEALLEEIKKLPHREDIHFLGYVEEKEIFSLTKNAQCVAIPSSYEGFCLPVLESLSVNSLLAGANAGAIPEVGGPFVNLFDPFDPESIAKTLSECLKRKSTKRSHELDEWLNRFSWEKCAKETLKVFKEAI